MVINGNHGCSTVVAESRILD